MPIRKNDQRLRLDDTYWRLETLFVPPTPALIRQIVAGPGLIAVTGQPGSGKSLTLFRVAYEAARSGRPVTVIWTKDTQIFDESLILPNDWKVRHLDSDANIVAEFWRMFAYQKDQIIVTDHPVLDLWQSEYPAPIPKDATIFCTFDTPLVGLDALYFLFGMLTQEKILKHLSGIVSQLLLPRLCKDCRQKLPASLEDTRLLDVTATEAVEIWQEVGCEKCKNSGCYYRSTANDVLWINDAVRPLIKDYLERNVMGIPPAECHVSMPNYAAELLRQGTIGLKTYKRLLFQNPLMRGHHLLQREKARAEEIKSMFGRFVTQQVAERMMSEPDLESVIAGESRHVTCLFTDIRGFTTRSEKAAPADIFHLLNEYFDQIVNIIFKHQGTIDKFIGDAIMVVFGAPLTTPNHPLDAVRCAIEVQQKIFAINAGHPDVPPVFMGIGINTGEAVAGCLGNKLRMDYTVLGDTVNTASRLEGKAARGQILIGPATYEAVKDVIDCKPMGQLQLKGKAVMLETYEVVFQAE